LKLAKSTNTARRRISGAPDMANITKKRTKAPPGGDGPGLYRVRHADGSTSDVVTLTEAREEMHDLHFKHLCEVAERADLAS
jgi:hypothetical protein